MGDRESVQWLQLLIQGGAVGLMVLMLVLLTYISMSLFKVIPGLIHSTLKEINDNNRESQKLQHENTKLERDGFAIRTRMLVEELTEIRRAFPMISDKVDKLIDTVNEQTAVIKEWPSDPAKVCQAHNILNRIEVLIALMERSSRPHRAEG